MQRFSEPLPPGTTSLRSPATLPPDSPAWRHPINRPKVTGTGSTLVNYIYDLAQPRHPPNVGRTYTGSLHQTNINARIPDAAELARLEAALAEMYRLEGLRYGADTFARAAPYRPAYRGSVADRLEDRVGGLDLDLPGGDALVFVDGSFVGNVDQFDGSPDYLWLPEGTHDLAFAREGCGMTRRRVHVPAGIVVLESLSLCGGSASNRIR